MWKTWRVGSSNKIIMLSPFVCFNYPSDQTERDNMLIMFLGTTRKHRISPIDHHDGHRLKMSRPSDCPIVGCTQCHQAWDGCTNCLRQIQTVRGSITCVVTFCLALTLDHSLGLPMIITKFLECNVENLACGLKQQNNHAFSLCLF